MKNPSIELKKIRNDRQKQFEKKNKEAALTNADRERRLKSKLERERIRRERLERESEESKHIREERERNEEEKKKEYDQRHEEIKLQLSRKMDQHVEDETSQRYCPSKRKKSFAEQDVGNCIDDAGHSMNGIPKCNDSGFFSSQPRGELKKLTSINVFKHADLRTHITSSYVLDVACYRIFYADVQSGIGLWGENYGKWSKSSNWKTFVERANSTFLNRYNITRPSLSDDTRYEKLEYKNGEYNFVITGSELSRFVNDIPVIIDSNNSTIELKDVVFRLTRPDSTSDDGAENNCTSTSDDSKHSSNQNTGILRYRTLKEQVAEMKFVLEAASGGFGAPCFGCFCYPARVKILKSGRRVQLYGSLYILKKAEKNLNRLSADRVNDVMKAPANKHDHCKSIQSGVGKYASTKLIRCIFLQAKECILNFDLKPGNVMICTDRTTFLVDFDSGMYADASEFTTWEGCLFVNLLLLCAHIKCWHNPFFSEAFVNAYRPLLLELCSVSRQNYWIFDARARTSKYIRGFFTGADQAKNKFESIVYSYFILEFNGTAWKHNPEFKIGEPIVPQMLKFILDGCSNSIDPEIKRVLGEV